jgi:acyl-CoA hydrolase
MPGDANAHGTAFGGVVMQWTDLAAGMSAMRHTRLPVVTAAIDQLSFLAPVRVGHQVILIAQVNAVFATSLEVGVEVLAEDTLTGERQKCCDAYLTFVALGADGKPTPPPPVIPETDEERRRQREAHMRREARRKLRLALRAPPPGEP